MKFSDEFESRFTEMLTHYPTKRSCLVPTLLYAQDEIGYISPAVISEVAQRVGIQENDVEGRFFFREPLANFSRSCIRGSDGSDFGEPGAQGLFEHSTVCLVVLHDQQADPFQGRRFLGQFRCRRQKSRRLEASPFFGP